MRKITKVLFGSAAVLATAALVQIATPATAGAEEATNPLAGKITVDAATQTVTINKDVLGADNNRQIYFGIAKVSSKKEVTAPTKWDVYDTAAATDDQDDLTISLASLKNTADNYIQIKGSADVDPVTILIPKAEKYKAKFDPTATNALQVTNAKKDSTGNYPPYSGTIEYRTQYGSWKDTSLTGNPFAAYQEQGATIYMRVPADSTASFETATGYTMKKKKATDPAVDVTVKKAASFASAEFKVSVKKRAEGPKVSVDFVKSTLSVPAGCEYRVVNVDALGTGAFGGAGEADAVSATKVVKSLTDTVVGAGTTAMIEQKKAAVTTGKKAIESKVAQLMVTRPENLEPDAEIGNSSNACVGKVIDSAVTITRTADLKKLTFENSSEKVYQVYLQKNDVTETDPKAGWKDIKAKKVSGSTTTNGKLSITLPTADTKIWIRLKGDAKTATLSSNALPLGKVKYDSTEAAAATANAKIADAVTALKKETSEGSGVSDAVKVATDKTKLTLPSAPRDVKYTWTPDSSTFIGTDGKLKSDIAADAISETNGTATVNLKVKVSATNGDDKYVSFVVTVTKTTVEGDNPTVKYEITNVAKGTDATA